MRARRYDREILHLAIPALGALAADPLVSLIDTAFVGRLGALPLAALGVNVALFNLAFVLFNFLAYGTTPRIGKALGRGDRAAAGRTVTDAFVLAAGLGVVVLALLQLFAVPLLRLMGAEGALLEPAETYLRIRVLAGPALLLITAANGAFRGFQDTRTPLVVTTGVAAVNLVLDPLFIFAFGWGLAGAAWATVIAQWAGAAAFLALVFGRLRGAWRVPVGLPTLRALVPFLRVGWALAIRTAALIGTLTAATAVATRVGVVEVAAHQVAAQLWMFLALVVDALAIAAQALVARYVGEGRPADARAVSDRLLAMGVGVGVALGVGFWLLRAPLAAAFADDPAVVAAIASVLPFVAAMQPVNALVFVWDGIFMAIEDFSFLAVAMLLSAAAGGAVLALVGPFGWGLAGVWWGITALMAARIVAMAWRYRPAGGAFRRAAERVT
ncbi:MAG: MATE family efflux transporter [Trueperaceae bacterium]|nr:MATE family efflux transporter [Trueperaceae bacterium]